MGNEGKDTYKFYLTDVNFGDGFFKLTGGCGIKFEANPNAPKDTEGVYTLTVNGRTVTLSDGKDKVEATCYYEDNFDIGEGVRQCFEKLKEARKKIKVGDMVEVVDNIAACVAYTNFFEQHDLMYYAPFYRYRNRPSNGTKGRVSYINENGFALIKVESHGEYQGVYIVQVAGLRKVVD